MADGKPEKSCCFAGQRDIPPGSEAGIKARVAEQVAALRAQGVSTFCIGGNPGFDMLAAELLLELREREDGYPVRVTAVLPYPGWDECRNAEERKQLDRVLERCDEVLFASPDRKNAVLRRDRKMADESAYCIAYCTCVSGGTAAFLRNAVRQGLQVVNTADWDLAGLFRKGAAGTGN